MALESIKNINVDFYDNRYILINTKQYDGNSRYITITCYDQGKIFNLSPARHTAYVRYRKSDGHTIFNFCTITPRGQVEVELTEQMLSSSGVCDVDLVIIHKGNAVVNIDTGEIITVDNSAIISTMVFRIYVYESAVDNSLIESSSEYNGLNDLLTRAEANYQQVINASETWALNSQSWAIGGTGVEGRKNTENTDNAKYYSKLSRSYAIGDADDVRSNEDVDNSKYYSEQSSDSADKSESYAVGGTGTRTGEDTNNSQYYSQMSKSYAMGGTGIEVRTDEDINNAEYYSRLAKSYTMGSFDGNTNTRDDESTENAKSYMETTKSYMEITDDYMDKTEEYMNTVDGYMDTTEEYMNATNDYMGTAKGYMESTDGYMETTKSYMDTVNECMNTTEGYMNDTKVSETNALNSANFAKSYTVGGTGTRNGEDTDNAQYYYDLIKNIINGIETGFIPMGTITFNELANVEKATGYVYNISTDFVTDETFHEGAGKSYTAGTNVYICADGMVDCFGGASSPTATLSEVKEYLGI